MWKLPQICVSALAGKNIVCTLLSQKQGLVRLCIRLITLALRTPAAQLSGGADNRGLDPRLTQNQTRSPIPRGGDLIQPSAFKSPSHMVSPLFRVRGRHAFTGKPGCGLPWSQQADIPVCSCSEHGCQNLRCKE